MTTPFISLTDLGNFTGVDYAGSDVAIIAIDSACERVRSYLSQHVNLVEDDEVSLHGTGTDVLLLPELPVRSISSVTETVNDEDTVLVDGTDYELGEAGMLYRLGAYWPRGKNNVTVVYTHGWDLSEDVQGSGDVDVPRVPSDLRYVALTLAADIVTAGTSGAGGVQSESIGDYSYKMEGTSTGGLDSQQKDILAPYARPV